MGQEINFTPATKMKKGYPKITKLGAVSPYGESTPFVFNNRVYRLELKDPTKGLDVNAPTFALIRDRETGEILSQFGEGCYYYSLYQEAGTVFVIGVKLQPPRHAGDTFWIYES